LLTQSRSMFSYFSVRLPSIKKGPNTPLLKILAPTLSYCGCCKCTLSPVRIFIISVSVIMSVYFIDQRKNRLIWKSNIVLKLNISNNSVHHQIAKLYTIKIIVRWFRENILGQDESYTSRIFFSFFVLMLNQYLVDIVNRIVWMSSTKHSKTSNNALLKLVVIWFCTILNITCLLEAFYSTFHCRFRNADVIWSRQKVLLNTKRTSL